MHKTPVLPVAAVVLAAGRGSRLGAPCKPLVDVNGRPLILHAVEAALTSRAAETFVVLGHAAEYLRTALAEYPVTLIENPEHAAGIGTSIRAALCVLPISLQGSVFLLADMPAIRARHVNQLLAAFTARGPAQICVPVHRGKRGNPVLWGRPFFSALMALPADAGGRTLFSRLAAHLAEIDMDRAILVDVDTPADLERARSTVSPDVPQ